MRRPTPPKNTRNGLKWREGRPRWEPSPASRAIGLKGCDLRDLDGHWIRDRGLAISLADNRHQWAQAIREAASAGPEGEDARADLRAVLEALEAPADADQRLRRLIVQDLVDHARRLIDGQDAAAGAQLVRGVRTIERLVEAYFAAADEGRLETPIKPATRKAYAAQKKPFLARFPGRSVASLKRSELISWYADLLEEGASLANANLRLAAASAWLTFAFTLDWIPFSPARELKLQKARGRKVFWTLQEERAFVAFCDQHGYEDVADAVTFGLWTGARPIDMCGANLEDLAGDVWHFVPVKTERKELEAMPGLLDVVKARIARRRAAAPADKVRHLNVTPFLFDPRTQRRYDPTMLRRRFVDVKGLAIAADAVPETLMHKRLQDMRDTCITRLWEAEVGFDRMWAWTGHSKESLEDILREHYINVRKESMAELAAKLQGWADREGVKLA